MNKFLAISAIALSISTFQPALANEHKGGEGVGREVGDFHHGNDDTGFGGKHGKFKDMSPEERQKFHEERRAKWESMSKEEKLQTIEKHRAERREKMEEKWNSMSDDEKIGFVEKRMKQKHERREGRREGRKGGDE